MDRIRTQDTAERIGIALELVPPRLWDYIGPVPFFEGDVAFAGLAHGGDYTYTRNGRELTTRREACALCHCRRRDFYSWVSLPDRYCGGPGRWPGVPTVLHELGHALWNRAVRRHEGRRCIWNAGQREVVVYDAYSGLAPSMVSVSGYAPDNMVEQFAELFSFWLCPTELLDADDLAPRPHPAYGIGARPAERLYYARPRGRLDQRGERLDNRHWLALLNGLAGLPSDTPPAALR